jgi:hypothetical protein
MDYSTSPTKENESPFDAGPKRSIVASPPNAMPGARPMSWQRRPNSQASDRPKSRPLSMVAAENAAARSTPPPSEPPSATELGFSKDQIAQALSSKDPSWFRQTADRGLNSAAYRKNQVEDEDRLDMSSVRAHALPGMSRENDRPISRAGTPRIEPPVQFTPAQRFDLPASDVSGDFDLGSFERPTLTSPGSGRTSPTRPLSPTKGMGGFVQSAMMKRSDSVKRWSVTSPPGLARADTVTSNRNSYDRTASPQPTSSRTSLIRDGSTTPSSRPTSRGATEDKTVDMDATPKQRVADPAPEARPISSSIKDEKDKITPPSSPSKTMDPRRWSPTKASWLETALNKPESPKPKPTPPPTNQPAWMVELNKAKAQKTGIPSAEVGRSDSMSRKHEVNIGGLMRSSPMGAAAKSAVAGIGGGFTPPVAGTRPGTSSSLRSSLSKSSTNQEVSESSTAAEESPDRSALSSTPASSKPKPETPPKKDFRANLKPRQPPADPSSKGDVNEFQNVFGNLRRTKTQNYVAPDTFKNNIVRGKEGLTITGGPKKTERKDEFKEAILKKKAEFKQAQVEGNGVTPNATAASEKPIPEGLAKRSELGRSTAASKRDSGTESTVGAPAKTEFERPISKTKRDFAEELLLTNATNELLQPLHKETSVPARLQGRAAGSALANRFNPALAGILARGPPPMATGGSKDSDDLETKLSSGSGDTSAAPTAPGPQLSHMTKGRARGPKRKAPTSAAASMETPMEITEETQASPPSPKSKQAQIAAKAFIKGETTLARPVDTKTGGTQVAPPSPKPIHAQVAAKAALKGRPLPVQVEDEPVEDYQVAPSSPTSRNAQAAAKVILKNRAPSPERRDEVPSQPSSPRKLDAKRRSAFLDSPSLPSPMAEPAKRSQSPTSPRKFDGPSNAVDRDPVVSVKSSTAIFGGASSLPLRSPPKDPKPAFGGPSPQFGSSSPTRASRPLPIAPSPGPTSPALTSSPMRSPTKQTMEVSALLEDFFGAKKPRRDYRTDTAEVLTNRPQVGLRVKSLVAQLFQLYSDGKKLPVPPHYERVLFEREMYICPHNYTNDMGRSVSEVYFWTGDEVPASMVEDAEVFVQREAKALGGKLVRIQQGKETPEFVQALGGIVITRRGSSNKYDSLAPNMLCGRRYLGQVAFDQVDFSPSSLCSGFPYLITQQGKCYLWKGKGSDVDELGCARLVGMDLTLTGELIEIDDGKEPATFWDIFDGGSKPHSADHWRLKPNYDKYCGRLFCSDATAKKQVSF